MTPTQTKASLGGNGGNLYNYIVGNEFDENLEIAEIRIRQGWYIDAIQIYYRDKRDGSIIEAPTYDGSGGNIPSSSSAPDPINFVAGERITEIDVTYGDYVNSLVIRTNIRIYGPYGGGDSHLGSRIGTLAVDDPNTQRVVGFFGRSGDFIDAIGILYI